MNSALELLFTAGQAASALLLIYGGFLVVALNLLPSVVPNDAPWRAPESPHEASR
jgi:hypothetical protein